ncbi:MAG: DMT family transporter [Alphaproteobacteria bacterium]|nr:DMT family transporter [Alphaproteobacteria bacterium]
MIKNLLRTNRSTNHAPGRGIGYMVIGGAIVTGSDAVVKSLPRDMPTGELLCLRGLFAVALIALFAWRTGGRDAFRVHSLSGQATRATLMVISSFSFVFSLRYMPLADATALLFFAPIMMTALAAIFLRETVGVHRWSAVGIGFMGVVMVVQPSPESINSAAMLAIFSALLAATRDVLTRKLMTGDSSISILFYTTLATTLAGAATLPFEWRPVGWAELGFLAATGIMSVVAHFLMIDSFRYAEAATIAPYKYFQLVTAAVLGFAFWGEVPGLWTVFGATLIVGGGLYIIRREVFRARIPPAAATSEH